MSLETLNRPLLARLKLPRRVMQGHITLMLQAMGAVTCEVLDVWHKYIRARMHLLAHRFWS